MVTITGGYNAEYGRANSGIVNVITKEGGEKYSGTAEFVTDGVTGNKSGYNLGEISLSGPVIPGYRGLRFFAAAAVRRFDDHAPSPIGVALFDTTSKTFRQNDKLPHNDQKGETFQAKLTYEPIKSVTVNLSYLGSKDVINEFTMDDGRQFTGQFFKHNLDHADRRRDRNHSFGGKITGVLNAKTFFTLESNYYKVSRRITDASLFSLSTDTAATRYSLNGFDTARNGPYRTDVFDLLILPGASPTRLLDRQSSYVGFKGTITSQISMHHEVKAGFEWQLHSIDYYNNGLPWSANARINQFHKEPKIAAGFVQDKIEYESLTINAGLRWDYLNANTQTYKDPKNPISSPKIGNKTDSQLSPRLGIGFPISDKTLFHLSYGRFFQPPDLFDLYIGDARLRQIAIQGTPGILGNPNLKSEKTSAYEVGFTREVSDNTGFDITAYFKDTANLINVTPVFGTPGTDIINRLALKSNADFGTTRGVDIKFERRRAHYIAGSLAYTLGYATGTGSVADDSFDQIFFALGPSAADVHLPKVSEPLSFDQRHTLVANLDIRADDLRGKSPLVRRLLANAGANIQFSAGSGLPYTPTNIFPAIGASQAQGRPLGRPNSARLPWQLQLDLKANKAIRFGAASFNIYLWVLNLTDRKNVLTVYSGTGRPDEDGFLASPEGQAAIEAFGDTKNQFGQTFEQAYRDLMRDPTFYGPPRQIRVGFTVNY
ncbi:MAG: TonB-dependent receptor [candidate division Zixibacteria bacterium]|nr:TonB-dependent receptor [candidate division Zixibacteria bacterium]